MTGHGQSPSTDEETPQEETEQSPSTYEEKLTSEIEPGGFDQQQEVASQVSIAAIFGLAKEGIAVKNASDFLREELDVNQLINDPKYKAEVEHAVYLSNKYSWLVKKGELADIIPRVETALARVEIIHEQTGKVKRDLSSQYAIEMKQAYGLNNEQFKAIREKAMERIKENPKLSMCDALRMEAREFYVKIVETDVKKDTKWYEWNKRREETKEKLGVLDLDGKEKAFLDHQQTAKIHDDVEKPLCDKINNRGIEAIKDTLGYKTQPLIQPQAAAIAPQVSIPPSTPSLSMPSSPPMSPLPISMPRFFPSLPSFSLPKFSLPNISFPKIGPILGPGGAFSKGFNFASKGLGNLAKNLATKLLPKLASLAFPPAAAVLGALSTLDALTGGLITKGAAILVGGVAALVIGLPLIGAIGMFSLFTGSNPLTITAPGGNPLGWNEFDKEYLTVQSNALVLDSSAPPQNDKKEITWQQFEKDNLSPLKQYLSLESSK